jgi:hypothetical protein
MSITMRGLKNSLNDNDFTVSNKNPRKFVVHHMPSGLTIWIDRSFHEGYPQGSGFMGSPLGPLTKYYKMIYRKKGDNEQTQTYGDVTGNYDAAQQIKRILDFHV